MRSCETKYWKKLPQLHVQVKENWYNLDESLNKKKSFSLVQWVVLLIEIEIIFTNKCFLSKFHPPSAYVSLYCVCQEITAMNERYIKCYQYQYVTNIFFKKINLTKISPEKSIRYTREFAVTVFAIVYTASFYFLHLERKWVAYLAKFIMRPGFEPTTCVENEKCTHWSLKATASLKTARATRALNIWHRFYLLGKNTWDLLSHNTVNKIYVSKCCILKLKLKVNYESRCSIVPDLFARAARAICHFPFSF